jgi:hypothetical protein
MNSLSNEKFDVAVYDTNHLGILPVLQLIGVKATIAVSFSAPHAVLFRYLGIPQPDSVPGFFIL